MKFPTWWPYMRTNIESATAPLRTLIAPSGFSDDELERQRQLHQRLDEVERVIVAIRGERRRIERHRE